MLFSHLGMKWHAACGNGIWHMAYGVWHIGILAYSIACQ